MRQTEAFERVLDQLISELPQESHKPARRKILEAPTKLSENPLSGHWYDKQAEIVTYRLVVGKLGTRTGTARLVFFYIIDEGEPVLWWPKLETE
ncbi:MAG: hypothetical protein JSS72_03320 [Armatimonadetes bacterium]|nr:hypothetical protein [Armatimonadota bacterium]